MSLICVSSRSANMDSMAEHSGRHQVQKPTKLPGTLELWQESYYMPLETSAEACLSQAKHLYKPPASDTYGIITALTVILCWAAVFVDSVFYIKLSGPHRSSLFHIAAAFCSLEFLFTGLFITTHDAMHGAVSFHNRKLNDAIGSIAISLYAWFDYRVLHKKHWEHHNLTGIVGQDPDFHRGDCRLIPWFVRFMSEYMTINQLVKIAAWAELLRFLGAPYENLVVFFAGAGLLSAFRLFYFGTYIPHRPSHPDQAMPWEVSYSSTVSPWISFLTCYHFDYHWEHHRWPYAPWWELHKCKQLRNKHLQKRAQ